LRFDKAGVSLLRSDSRMSVSRFLIGLGIVALAAGLLWPLLSRLGLGRLPGDIVVERGNYAFYFPVVTCIILSIVVSVIWSLFSR